MSNWGRKHKRQASPIAGRFNTFHLDENRERDAAYRRLRIGISQAEGTVDQDLRTIADSVSKSPLEAEQAEAIVRRLEMNGRFA